MFAADFDAHFRSTFGPEWPALREALVRPPRQLTLANPFGLDPYVLDEASVHAARALDVRAGHRVLDLCASPGGKALTTIFDTRGEAEWTLNDLSSARAARLRAILHDCVPATLHVRVRVTVGDGARFGLRHPGGFDRVLVDAPCSGERHLLAKPSELARWSLKASKRLAVRQHALLCAGLDALTPGGRLVYSTCTLSALENDGVLAKLAKSRAGMFELARPADELGQPTEFGRLIRPDRDGCGPIFYAVIAKNGE